MKIKIILKSLLAPLTLLLAALSGLGGCTSKETFPSLEDRIASPVDVAVSDDGQFFYVLNSDFDRTYNKGSVLTLDKDGNKLGVVEVPRMGRTLTVTGTDMLVTIDQRRAEEPPMLLLFDLSKNPQTPELKAEFILDCTPFNAVMSKGYQHFAVTCIDGQLYIGTLAANRSDTGLTMVRNYGIARHALYLDPNRELLLGFTSDPRQRILADSEMTDATRYDANAKELLGDGGVKIPNEVPDIMENKTNAQANRATRKIYQFFVYDIAKERSNAPGCIKTPEETCAFPFRPLTAIEVAPELRWIYFNLQNFDGTPDASTYANDPTYKYYRTNFWDARPDPDDNNIFYLSHRNAPDKGPHANQIVKVSILGDLRPNKNDVPNTANVMSFERVYGFKGSESAATHYPGDFKVLNIQGTKSLLVNHFRDLVNWNRKDQYFSLAAKSLDDTSSWSSEVQGSLSATSATTFYQVAANSTGRVMSCSFYGNAVILLDLIPGVGFQQIKRIN